MSKTGKCFTAFFVAVAIAVGFFGFTNTGHRFLASIGLIAACDGDCS